jgi:hypothetical protein
MSKRKAISKRIRFEVFHRDGFRCRYCGATGDGITLHLDHVVAVANGGTNAISNLLTACADCNLGKGATELVNHPDKAGGPIKCPFAEGWPHEIEDPVFYANATWAVTAYGLESLITFYPIQASRLAETRNGMSDWLLHLAEKEHFAESYDDLVAAFTRALRHHGTQVGFDLDASIAAVRREARGTLQWPHSDPQEPA